MYDFTTELIKNLSNNISVEEIFRVELEKAFNQLLETELDCFLGYEKYSKDGYNTGDSRNGYYKRTFQTKYGELKLSIPRDRAGEFKQQTLPSHARSDDSLEQMVILMYSKGVTTREIAELIEKMYGHYYSRQTISNITQTVQEQVSAFHNRSISKRFVVLYNGFNLVVIDNPSIFIMIGKDTFIIQKAFHNMLIYYLSESSMFVVP